MLRTISLLLVGLLLASPAAASSSASANVLCGFEAGVLSVAVDSPTEPVSLVVAGSEIVVKLGQEPVTCPGSPEVDTTDLVQLSDVAPQISSTIFVIDLSGGPFAPGLTDEGDGGSEIEFIVDMGPGTLDELRVVGTSNADDLALSSEGINLDRTEPVRDWDVELIEVARVRLDLGDGADIVRAGGGPNTDPFRLPMRVFGGAGADDLEGGEGSDHLHGGEGPDVLQGLGGADVLSGGAAGDTLLGGDGADLLDGGPGDDVEEGGFGDDVFDQGDASNGGDTLRGGVGDADAVSYQDRQDPVSVSDNGSPDDGAPLEGDDVGDDIEIMIGGHGDDTLIGGVTSNHLIGGGGDDELFGGAGDDQLSGGHGDDLLVGEEGRDLVSYFGAPGPMSVDLDAGTASGWGEDTLESVEDVSGGAFADTLRGDDGDNRLSGAGRNDRLIGLDGDDELRGQAGADTLLGGPGDDTLRGGAGADRLRGHAGNDLIVGGAGKDLADFAGAGRRVTVNLTRRRASGEGADTLRGIESVRGGSSADILIGDAGPNLLMGSGGPDTIRGRGGPDVLIGGGGNDRMFGGGGADLFVVGTKDDGADRLSGGPGRDEVDYRRRKRGVRIRLDARANDGYPGERDFVMRDVEVLRGGRGPDRLIADGGSDTLLGRGGDDRLEGGAGNDVLRGGAGRNVLIGGPGSDLCRPRRDRMVGCER